MLLFLLMVCEVISVMMIYRLWTCGQGPGILERSFLSVVLLVPVIGWLFYIFVRLSPGPHGEDVGGHSSGYGSGDSNPGHH